MKHAHRLNVAIIIVLFFITAIAMLYLPKIVVTHGNFQHPDGWGSKYTYFLLPIFCLVGWLIAYYSTPAFIKSEEKKGMGEIYVSNKLKMYNITIHIFLLFLVGLDIYDIMEAFEWSSMHIPFESRILIMIAFIHVYIALLIFFLTKNELLYLHWKEFKINDSEAAICIRKYMILIASFILAIVLLYNAFYYYVPFIVTLIPFILLIIKFLYGFISAKFKKLPIL